MMLVLVLVLVQCWLCQLCRLYGFNGLCWLVLAVLLIKAQELR